MKSEPSLVAIKGSKHGLVITLLNGESGPLIAELNERLARTAAFFKGAQVTLNVENAQVGAGELQQIQEMLQSHDITLRKLATQSEPLIAAGKALGVEIESAPSEMPVVQRLRSDVVAPNRSDPAPSSARRPLNIPAMPSFTEAEGGDGERAATAWVVRRTLRSGMAARHDGHVIIIGDVNPGAEVIARGDVIVWGKLRGMVHAGALGDPNAIVCALHLEPTQLRIANSIARMPESKRRKFAPEMASIQDGKIEVIEWH